MREGVRCGGDLYYIALELRGDFRAILSSFIPLFLFLTRYLLVLNITYYVLSLSAQQLLLLLLPVLLVLKLNE